MLNFGGVRGGLVGETCQNDLIVFQETSGKVGRMLRNSLTVSVGVQKSGLSRGLDTIPML